MPSRVPVFVEVITTGQHASVQLCRKIMILLFKEKVAPLPFATTAKEVADVLAALKSRGMTPAVFIINTFYAEELMPQIDALMGETPVVYLRRQIFADPLSAKPGSAAATGPNVTEVLQKMTPRPNVEWIYGSQTADDVAAKGANALLQFLNDGNFAVLESYAQTQMLEMLRSHMDPRGDGIRPGRPGTGRFSPVGQ